MKFLKPSARHTHEGPAWRLIQTRRTPLSGPCNRRYRKAHHLIDVVPPIPAPPGTSAPCVFNQAKTSFIFEPLTSDWYVSLTPKPPRAPGRRPYTHLPVTAASAVFLCRHRAPDSNIPRDLWQARFRRDPSTHFLHQRECNPMVDLAELCDLVI